MSIKSGFQRAFGPRWALEPRGAVEALAPGADFGFQKTEAAASGRAGSCLYKNNGAPEASGARRLSSRRGIALPIALVVMLLFAVLCVAMFTLSHMNITYDLYFERRTVLEHATVSMAEALGRKLRQWVSDDAVLRTRLEKPGKGSLIIGNSASSLGSKYSGPAMRFTFDVASSDKPGYLLLSVLGEYGGAGGGKNDNAAWHVSLDVATNPGSSNEFRFIGFGSPDVSVLWPKSGDISR